VRVHQPGSALTRERGGGRIDDWSWRATARRIATLGRLTAPYKLRTGLALLFLVLATAVALLPPYLTKLAIDQGILAHDLAYLSKIVALFILAGIAVIATSAAQTYFTGWTGERILADLRSKMFRHLQRLSLGYFERNRAGVIISRITNDVEALDLLVTDGVTSLVQNSLTLIGTAVIMFFLDWRLALATMTILPLVVIATALFRKHSSLAYRQVRERLGLVTAALAEDIAGMRVVQAFTREKQNEAKFREINVWYRAANQRTIVLNGIYFPVVDFFSSLATAIVIGYGSYRVFGGATSVGTMTAFVLYLSNFFDPVQQLSQLYNTFLSAVAALDRITELLDEQPEIVDHPGAVELPHIQGRVAFEDVRFSYGKGVEVLHGISLDVPAGTTVALVGHTGAGKSTIAKLIARFYEPQSGRITIDGNDINHVTQRSLRSQLGVVPQEGFLFAGSVRDNIAFARPDATEAEVLSAAETVGAHDFITKLEDGYETNLQERGTRLSSGQRQLVALSRALLADPRILILDEATSAVDIGTERKIESALRLLLHGRTAFVIAHRLSTIRNADLIVVLEHGKIVEQGTHDELLERRGLYTSLYGDWAAKVA
jgi:ATP-binding cassette subfamily B protein